MFAPNVFVLQSVSTGAYGAFSRQQNKRLLERKKKVYSRKNVMMAHKQLAITTKSKNRKLVE
jgi:hypothetical protein